MGSTAQALGRAGASPASFGLTTQSAQAASLLVRQAPQSQRDPRQTASHHQEQQQQPARGGSGAGGTAGRALGLAKLASAPPSRVTDAPANLFVRPSTAHPSSRTSASTSGGSNPVSTSPRADASGGRNGHVNTRTGSGSRLGGGGGNGASTHGAKPPFSSSASSSASPSLAAAPAAVSAAPVTTPSSAAGEGERARSSAENGRSSAEGVHAAANAGVDNNIASKPAAASGWNPSGAGLRGGDGNVRGGGGGDGKSNGKSKSNITIHVFDEARGSRKDFSCDLPLLLREMRYFRNHLSSVDGPDEVRLPSPDALHSWNERKKKMSPSLSSTPVAPRL